MPKSSSISSYPHAPSRTKDEAKIGGRGPNVLPPAGGHGGGDENWDRPQKRTGPRDRLNRYRMGLLLGVVSIFMLFIGLTLAYMLRHAGGKMDAATGVFIHDWRPLVIPSILWFNTALLLLSSLSIEVARRHNFYEAWVMEEWLGLGRPTRAASLPWLAITLVLGFGFLIGQYQGWRELMSQGIFVSGNPSSSFFFLLTGAHAIHLLGGILALIWAGISTFASRPLESRQIATDITAWYWHAMGLLWVGILAALHLMK
jgi:cytochrome c oxidase subunit 3